LPKQNLFILICSSDFASLSLFHGYRNMIQCVHSIVGHPSYFNIALDQIFHWKPLAKCYYIYMSKELHCRYKLCLGAIFFLTSNEIKCAFCCHNNSHLYCIIPHIYSFSGEYSPTSNYECWTGIFWIQKPLQENVEVRGDFSFDLGAIVDSHY
jgi:hypothetical protein